ncbi:unnamed protein product [Coregonus sp. 'balchen']|nr:unnamed protein product [Coregonus sp. 'balchen']
MSRPTFSTLLTATTLRFLRQRPLLCAAGLVLATGSAVYFYRKYYGVGEDEPATMESVYRVVTVEEDHEPTLDQEDPVLVQPTYYLTHAGRMLVRELAVLNTQIFSIEQPILICFSRAGRMIWDELSSQSEEYVDEEVRQQPCLALIPWSGPLWVSSASVTLQPTYYLTHAGRMLVRELAVLNPQYVDEEVRQQPCLALIPWSGPLWVSSASVTLQPTYYLTHAGRMLVRELAVLNTQIFTMEQPIFICFTPARRMVWEELSSQNEQYVDEEVGQWPCLAIIPWSGPLYVPVSPKPVYYLTRAGRILVRELAVLNTQPNSEDSRFPYEKLQLVGNWGSFHFHYWKIHYGRVQQNEEDLHHLCIVRGVEKQLWWSRVIQEKILDSWGLVQVVLTNKELTGIKFLGRRIYGLRSCLVKMRSEFTYYEDAQVDISTTVEGFQERGDEMTSYQFSTSDIITTPHEPFSGSSHQFPQDSPPPPPPFPSDSPPSPPPPYHSTQDQDQTPDSTPHEFVEEQNNVADVPQLWSYFGNQGTTNFSLRLAGIRHAMEALTSSDSTSLNYLTTLGGWCLSGLSELNQQDVRQFQQAYDLLVNFINEPANRERLEQEMALIDRINFVDVFYEFVLLSLLEGKTSLPTSVKAPSFFFCMEMIKGFTPLEEPGRGGI